jgi:hypothetical protein
MYNGPWFFGVDPRHMTGQSPNGVGRSENNKNIAEKVSTSNTNQSQAMTNLSTNSTVANTNSEANSQTYHNSHTNHKDDEISISQQFNSMMTLQKDTN